jgi:hypothetical protein
VGAQGTRTEKETLVVEPGNDFRAALEKGVRLKAVGQPITAKLLEPVYAGEVLAVPAGSTIRGHVSAISTALAVKPIPSSTFFDHRLCETFSP